MHQGTIRMRFTLDGYLTSNHHKHFAMAHRSLYITNGYWLNKVSIERERLPAKLEYC